MIKGIVFFLGTKLPLQSVGMTRQFRWRKSKSNYFAKYERTASISSHAKRIWWCNMHFKILTFTGLLLPEHTPVLWITVCGIAWTYRSFLLGEFGARCQRFLQRCFQLAVLRLQLPQVPNSSLKNTRTCYNQWDINLELSVNVWIATCCTPVGQVNCTGKIITSMPHQFGVVKARCNPFRTIAENSIAGTISCVFAFVLQL